MSRGLARPDGLERLRLHRCWPKQNRCFYSRLSFRTGKRPGGAADELAASPGRLSIRPGRHFAIRTRRPATRINSACRTLLKLRLAFVPSAETIVIQTTRIRSGLTAYSTAVGAVFADQEPFEIRDEGLHYDLSLGKSARQVRGGPSPQGGTRNPVDGRCLEWRSRTRFVPTNPACPSPSCPRHQEQRNSGHGSVVGVGNTGAGRGDHSFQHRPGDRRTSLSCARTDRPPERPRRVAEGPARSPTGFSQGPPALIRRASYV